VLLPAQPFFEAGFIKAGSSGQERGTVRSLS
jgi:hypothetical protein